MQDAVLTGCMKLNVSDDELGKVAYTAYAAAVGGKAFNGDPLPDWATMKADEKKATLVKAWIAAAKAVGLRVARSIPAPKPSTPVLLASDIQPPSVAAAVAASRGYEGAPPAIRRRDQRTKCCGSWSLSLKNGAYRCPCGDHVEAL